MTTAVSLWSVLGPALTVSGALVLIALERRFPYVPGQRFWRDGFSTDLVGYTFLQSYVLGVLIGGAISRLDAASHLSRLHLVSGWPVAAQVLFFVVTHDLYIYLFHRLQHRNRWLWRIHEAHHATRDVDWLSGSRSHALEILINQTIEFAPIVLLGAAPEVALIKVTLDALWGMYIHANIDVRSGRLQFLLNGPEMHRWHHAREIRTGINFGTKLAIWDWCFGSASLPPAPAKPRGYGLSEPFPRGYLAQQLCCFGGHGRGRARTCRPAKPPLQPGVSTEGEGERAGSGAGGGERVSARTSDRFSNSRSRAMPCTADSSDSNISARTASS